jgi:MFS family permease
MGNPYLAVAAVILGVAVLQVANGVLTTILPITLTEAGYSSQAFSIVAMTHSLSFLAGCLMAKTVIRSIGHIRAFAVYAALTSVTALAFSWEVTPAFWMGLRLVTGFCSAGVFTVAESWLNDVTPRPERGKVFAVYTIVQKVTLVAGQSILLASQGPLTLGLFMVASAFYSLSLVPVALNQAAAPAIGQLQTLSLRHLYALAPAAMIGCLGTGLINGGVLAIAPIWGLKIGLSDGLAGAIPAMAQVGNLVAQWPLGWVSDRIDRRFVIVGGALVTLGASLALALAPGVPWVLALLFGIWGAGSLSVYAVCVAHANDFAPRGTAVAVSSSLLLTWGVGASVGPFLASAAMDMLGPHGLFVHSIVVAGAMAGFTVFRMTRRRTRPASERDPFVNLVATSPEIGELAATSRRS